MTTPATVTDLPVRVPARELAALRRKVAAADAFAELIHLRDRQGLRNVPRREFDLFDELLKES